MVNVMRLMFLWSAVILLAAPAAAQDRPFLFLTTTAEKTRPAARFDYEVGLGEGAFHSDGSNQPEQRVGVQATFGRMTFLGRFGISDAGSSYQSSQSGEALYSLIEPGRRIALAAGGGIWRVSGTHRRRKVAPGCWPGRASTSLLRKPDGS